jgi:CRP-like cAMP-binding protein
VVPPAIRRLEVVALGLSAIALLLCLQFVWRTTGGTLILFSVVAPLLVLTAILIVAATAIFEYRQAHSLFAIQRHPAGHVIFRQGEEGDCAYFIRTGSVQVLDEVNGEEFARLGPGDYFGEMALLGDLPRNATVRSLSPVELAVLGKENFLSMIRLLPATEEAVLETVRRRAMGARSPEVGLSPP